MIASVADLLEHSTPLGTASREPTNAFSIDVEDYYQVSAFEGAIPKSSWPQQRSRVEQNLTRLIELCDQHQIRATLFVLGWIGERYGDLIRQASAEGHEIAIHGYDHARVTTMTPETFREDLKRSKDIIESLIGQEVIGYRAPSFSIVESTLWALDILVEEGFRYDSSIFPIRHDRYGIPEAPRFPFLLQSETSNRDHQLVEYPISTIRVSGLNLPFSGGGYIRQFPFWYTRWALRHLNQVEGRPAVVYVHPWEIDPDQPRVEVGWLTRMRHYRNIPKTEGRLSQLFREFRFSTVREVLGFESKMRRVS